MEMKEAEDAIIGQSSDGAAFLFDASNEKAKSLKAGDVLLVKGLIARKVLGAETEPEGVIVLTQQATIPDVVQQGPRGVESTSGSGRLVRVQTPQAFRAQPLLRAYRAAAAQGFEGTDTSSCIEKYTDEQVRTFPGGEANLKVTYAHDVAVAGHLLSRR